MLHVYETSQTHYTKLTPLQELLPVTGIMDQAISITIDPSKTFQEFLGFGGAITEAAASTFDRLSREKQKEFMQAYFSQAGLAYSFARTHINSCDFSLENYAYVEENDTCLQTFSLDRERRFVIPFLKKAIKTADNPIFIVSSPWSPPAWMKTNHSMNQGGSLKANYRALWADYMSRYIKEMARENIDIWGVTVQNEPEAAQIWDSCLYSAEEERDFVKNYLGPGLLKNGLGHIKIIIHDHNRDRLFERARIILNDEEAARYIWGAGFHWYDGGNYQNLEYFHEYFPDKKLIFTEGCQERGTHHNSWALGELYGQAIINDLNRNTVAWIDWNILLDMSGGPNHVFNLCSAPVLGDPETDQLFYESSYYYIAHFSRFINRGARRCFCSVSINNLSATAFINPDGSLAIVLINTTDKEQNAAITIDKKTYPCRLAAHTIKTLVTSESYNHK